MKKSALLKPPAKKSKKPLPLWIWLIGIIVLTVIVYLPAFTNGFTNWDDTYYVTNNIQIHSLSLQNISAFFSSLQTQGNYHPLTLLSLAIDYKLFGLNATGYHTINILLHVLNSCLVFLLIQKLFKSEFITIATTILFAIHPMHVESVAWVSERKDVLYVLFYLSGLWCYTNYIDKQKRIFIVWTILCFVLSLLSKAQAVTFPLALLLIDYIHNGKVSLKDALIKIPLLILSLVFGIVAVYTQSSVNGVANEIYSTFADRILLSGYAFALYIVKFFVPVKLAAIYPYPGKSNGWFNPLIYVSILIPIAFVILIAVIRKNKIVLSGLLFFIINIALLIQLLPVGDAVMSERYTYLSYLGLFWALAYYVRYLIRQAIKLRPVIIIVCCGYIGLLACLSYQRTQIWYNSLSLWTDELGQFTNVPVAWNNLGLIKQSNNDINDALACYSNAILWQPDYGLALVNRGIIYSQLGAYGLAIQDETKALKVLPENKSAYLTRGLCYANAGKTDSALADCRWLITHYPSDSDVHAVRANAFINAQQPDSALTDCNWIIYHYPHDENVYFLSGVAYGMLSQFYKASENFNIAIQLNPDDWSAYGNRARVYLMTGDNERAINDATTAINNYHGSPASFLATRAQAYYNLGRYNESLHDYLLLQKIGLIVSPSILSTLNNKLNKNR